MALISNSIFPEEKVPVGYGCHPKLVYSYKKFRKETLKRNRKGKSWDKNRVSLADIPKSGNIYLIPRDRYIDVIDESGDLVAVEGLDKATFPFSSYDLYADIFEDKYFQEFLHYAFYRLGEISQLGYLVPPRPEEWDPKVTITYLVPAFPHTRWAHSRLVAFLMEVILA